MISVVPYDPVWPQQFEQEKTNIQKALKDSCLAIHHIGSTSVPGLVAKPKIDILALAKNRDLSLKALEEIGYIQRGEWNIPLQCGLIKRKTEVFEQTGNFDVNLHLFFHPNHPEIELNLRFRDYLRAHQYARDQYAKIKMDILKDPSSHKKSANGFPVYTLHKAPFIQSVLGKLGYNRFRMLKPTTQNEWNFMKALVPKSKRKEEKKDLQGDRDETFIFYHGIQPMGGALIHIASSHQAHISFFKIEESKIDRKSLSEASLTETILHSQTFFTDFIHEWCKIHELSLS